MSVFDYDKNRDNRKPFHASGMAENAAKRATEDNQDKYAKQDNTPSGSNGNTIPSTMTAASRSSLRVRSSPSVFSATASRSSA